MCQNNADIVSEKFSLFHCLLVSHMGVSLLAHQYIFPQQISQNTPSPTCTRCAVMSKQPKLCELYHKVEVFDPSKLDKTGSFGLMSFLCDMVLIDLSQVHAAKAP